MMRNREEAMRKVILKLREDIGCECASTPCGHTIALSRAFDAGFVVGVEAGIESMQLPQDDVAQQAYDLGRLAGLKEKAADVALAYRRLAEELEAAVIRALKVNKP